MQLHAKDRFQFLRLGINRCYFLLLVPWRTRPNACRTSTLILGLHPLAMRGSLISPALGHHRLWVCLAPLTAHFDLNVSIGRMLRAPTSFGTRQTPTLVPHTALALLRRVGESVELGQSLLFPAHDATLCSVWPVPMRPADHVAGRRDFRHQRPLALAVYLPVWHALNIRNTRARTFVLADDIFHRHQTSLGSTASPLALLDVAHKVLGKGSRKSVCAFFPVVNRYLSTKRRPTHDPRGRPKRLYAVLALLDGCWVMHNNRTRPLACVSGWCGQNIWTSCTSMIRISHLHLSCAPSPIILPSRIVRGHPGPNKGPAPPNHA